MGGFSKSERSICLGSTKMADSSIFLFEAVLPPISDYWSKSDPGLLTYLAMLCTDILMTEFSSINFSRSRKPSFLSSSGDFYKSADEIKKVLFSTMRISGFERSKLFFYVFA